jgi:hypothetical protein
VDLPSVKNENNKTKGCRSRKKVACHPNLSPFPKIGQGEELALSRIFAATTERTKTKQIAIDAPSHRDFPEQTRRIASAALTPAA